MKLSMRFVDPGVENGYLRHLSERLVSSMFVLGITICICQALNLLNELVIRETDCYADMMIDVANRCLTLNVARGCDACMGVVGAVMAVLMKTQQRRNMLTPRSVESLVSAACHVIMILGVLTDSYYVGKIFLNWSLPWDREDSWVMLFIQTCITISHLMLPLRWCALWHIEVLSVFGYTALRSWVGYFTWTRFLTLGLMVMASTFGKRSLESFEREAYRKLLEERTLRVMSESKLSQVQSRSRGQQRRATDDVYSVASGGAGGSTVASDASRSLFDQSVTSSNAVSRLGALVAAGRREGWLLELEELNLKPHCVLGHGSFGIVVEGEHHGLNVAVKMSRLRMDSSSEQRVPAIIAELQVLRRVKHPNIATFYGTVVDPCLSEIALALERVRGVSLEHFIGNPSALNPIVDVERFGILFGLSRALCYLHGGPKPIMHGDLKPQNVMIEQSGLARTRSLLTSAFPESFPGGRGLPAARWHGWLQNWSPRCRFRLWRRTPIPSASSCSTSFNGTSSARIRKALETRHIRIPACPIGAGEFLASNWNSAIVCSDLEPADRPTMREAFSQVDFSRNFLPTLTKDLPDPTDSGDDLQPWSRGAIVVRSSASSAFKLGVGGEGAKAVAAAEAGAEAGAEEAGRWRCRPSMKTSRCALLRLTSGGRSPSTHRPCACEPAAMRAD
eukprot:CAMPEP_0176122214 /NCGR_PEP_ID=MMETSP0120_2-20121206/61546_1 /TAXON_ID=160619 /ORGANISM="Kryptoperidinium foliaceum, Strain CCMP 1326" /LENGTH=676 /DNA_ID=CAMNT_0017456825 /DNA_START=90 /DNA_END=2119 /DNA_ORIENTATION=+